MGSLRRLSSLKFEHLWGLEAFYKNIHAFLCEIAHLTLSRRIFKFEKDEEWKKYKFSGELLNWRCLWPHKGQFSTTLSMNLGSPSSIIPSKPIFSFRKEINIFSATNSSRKLEKLFVRGVHPVVLENLENFTSKIQSIIQWTNKLKITQLNFITHQFKSYMRDNSSVKAKPSGKSFFFIFFNNSIIIEFCCFFGKVVH